ncbi:MAG: helix-turn-helix transcriptional regulator [Ruminococcaceae bacterium]|nr:helix-turn-helix transcriptional regulator [Oscillospiraceae bacterium]
MDNIESIVVTKLHSVMDLKNPVFENMKKRNRSVHGLCFPISGTMVYHHNGKSIVSDRQHAVLIPQGATYTYSCIEEGEFPLINFYTTDDFSPSEIIVYEIDDITEYINHFRELEKISLLTPLNGHLKAIKIIYEILIRLHKVELNKNSASFDTIRASVNYLQNHFSDAGLTNKVLAEKSMISEIYFRKLFKENFGVSPKQYIQELRILKAKNLLKGNLCATVSEVAEEIGFSNVYQFSAAFKKATGYTPTDFIKSFKSTEEF